MTLIEKMYDLLKQATTERSHYYVASILKEAIDEIKRLNADIKTLRECYWSANERAEAEKEKEK